MKLAKVVAVTGAALALLACMLMVGANFLVPPEHYKLLLEKTAHENGISLKIAGGLHWSFMPAIGFSATDVQLKLHPDKKSELKTIHIDSVSLSLGILDLLGGKLDIKAFVFENVIFFTNDVQTLRFNNALLKTANANTRGEKFPVELTLDDARISGDISLNSAGKLHLDVDLHGDRINLDRYASPEEATTHLPAEKQVMQTGKSPRDHHAKEESSPLTGLLKAPGNYKLRFDHIIANHIQLSNVVFDAKVEDTRVTLNSLDADLYQGTLSTTGNIGLAAGKNPEIQMNVVIKQVAITPFLTDLQQQKPAVSAGKLNFSASLHGKGSSHNKIMATLTGTASADIDNLVLRGNNLENLACEAASLAQKIAPDNNGLAEDTTIRNLHAESRIVNGIAIIAPLTIRMDSLAVNGGGPVSLASNTMDIRLAITIQETHDCPAIKKAVTDIAWPVRCEGNYITAPEKLCVVDKSEIGKIIRQIAIKNLKIGDDSLKDKLQNLFQ